MKLNNDFVEAKKHVASSIADEKRLALQFQQELAHAAGWAERATKATATNASELAREALARKDEHETLAQDLREQWSAQKERVDCLKRTLRGMNVLLERAKRTKDSAIARKRYARREVPPSRLPASPWTPFSRGSSRPAPGVRGLENVLSTLETGLEGAAKAVATCAPILSTSLASRSSARMPRNGSVERRPR